MPRSNGNNTDSVSIHSDDVSDELKICGHLPMGHANGILAGTIVIFLISLVKDIIKSNFSRNWSFHVIFFLITALLFIGLTARVRILILPYLFLSVMCSGIFTLAALATLLSYFSSDWQKFVCSSAHFFKCSDVEFSFGGLLLWLALAIVWHYIASVLRCTYDVYVLLAEAERTTDQQISEGDAGSNLKLFNNKATIV